MHELIRQLKANLIQIYDIPLFFNPDKNGVTLSIKKEGAYCFVPSPSASALVFVTAWRFLMCQISNELMGGLEPFHR